MKEPQNQRGLSVVMICFALSSVQLLGHAFFPPLLLRNVLSIHSRFQRMTFKSICGKNSWKKAESISAYRENLKHTIMCRGKKRHQFIEALLEQQILQQFYCRCYILFTVYSFYLVAQLLGYIITDTPLGVSVIICPVRFPIQSWWLILEMYRLAVMESILAALARISASTIWHQNQESV